MLVFYLSPKNQNGLSKQTEVSGQWMFKVLINLKRCKYGLKKSLLLQPPTNNRINIILALDAPQPVENSHGKLRKDAYGHSSAVFPLARRCSEVLRLSTIIHQTIRRAGLVYAFSQHRWRIEQNGLTVKRRRGCTSRRGSTVAKRGFSNASGRGMTLALYDVARARR